MKLRFIVSLMLTAVACAPLAQPIRRMLATSDLVVVGEFEDLLDAPLMGSRWRNDTPEDKELFEIATARIKVLRYIKGSGPARLDVALPRNLTYLGPRPRSEAHRYDVRKGTKAAWFLQRGAKGKESVFYQDDREVDPRYADDRYANMWSAPGHDFAPAYMGGYGSQIVFETTQAASSLSGILQLADLFAANARASEPMRGYFLGLLQYEMRPEQPVGTGDIYDRAKEEWEACMRWLKNRFPVQFPPTDDNALIDSLAIRMTWGERGLSKHFTDLCIRLRGGLRANLPSLPAQERLRMFPAVDSRIAAHAFAPLKYCPQYKQQATRIGVQRLGEHHDLDVAILEVLSELWNRSDLSPFKRTEDGRRLNPFDDLSRQIAAAKRLLRQ